MQSQCVDITLDIGDLPDLVTEDNEPVETVCYFLVTHTNHVSIQPLPYILLLQIQFHRETHLGRYEAMYKVGVVATGQPCIGQHLDRCPCFRNDKVFNQNLYPSLTNTDANNHMCALVGYHKGA